MVMGWYHMARNLLNHAAGEVDAASEAVTDPDTRDRLAGLADQLRSQAEREATPALGALDRIHTKLREIQHYTGEPSASEALENAQDDILSFLETLDDRGMKQHGESQNADENMST